MKATGQKKWGLRTETYYGLTKSYLLHILLTDCTGLLVAAPTFQAGSYFRLFAFALPSTRNAVLAVGPCFLIASSLTYAAPCPHVTSSGKTSMTDLIKIPS